MATDTADQLARVHALATRHTLAELGAARRRLDRVLALAPADATRAIDRATTDLDALRARQHLHDSDQMPPRRAGQLGRAIARAQRRLTAAKAQQVERDAWMAANADVVDRHTVLVRAERHRRARITADPLRFLQADTADAGPEPRWQDQRRQWRTALVQQALAGDVRLDQPARDAGSAEVEVG